MPKNLLLKLYSYTYQVACANVDGVSNAESLVQPEKHGNCLNWVMGHIVAYRNEVLKVLGEEPVMSETDVERYKRGSEPITCEGSSTPLDRLLDDFDTSQERLNRALENISEETLNRKMGEETVASALGGLQFHEAYHVGQLGVLRRIVGKSGAIT
ncbi:MAG: DinB family protein [Candidatus Krumholzibacteriia bacterium]